MSVSKKKERAQDGFRQLSRGRFARFQQKLKGWDERFPLSLFVLSFLVSAVLLAMIRHERSPEWLTPYKEGDLARETIRAPYDLELVDTIASDNARMELFSRIPEVYDFDGGVGDLSKERWSELLRGIRQLSLTDESGWSRLEQRLELRLGTADRALLSRLSHSNHNALEAFGLSALNLFTEKRIVESTLSPSKAGIELLHTSDSNGERVASDETRSYISINEARTKLSRSAETLDIEAETSSDRQLWSSWTRSERELLGSVVAKFLRPSVTLNNKESEVRRAVAIRELDPHTQRLSEGEVIVREGERVAAREAAMIAELMRLQSSPQKNWLAWLTEALFGALILWFLALFIRHKAPQIFGSKKDVSLLVVSYVLSVAILKLLLIFELEVLATHFHKLPPSFFLFLTPLVAPAMILRLLLGTAPALIFSGLFAVTAAILVGQGATLFGFYIAVSCATGVLVMARCQTRGDFYRAGLKSAMVCALLAAALSMAWGGQVPPAANFGNLETLKIWPYSDIVMWAFLGGFLGGWLSSALALALIPLLESLFDYTTELKLLELARMDHPLLRELVLKAPGTYHHSIIVGSLVEAGAEAVGANALLARVGSYYHDIGKIGRAEYFIENQSAGYNPHDHTKAALSAKIIISHVKEGRLLAERYRLGQSIIDFIEQHHGRSMVSYFYDKAKQEAAKSSSGEEIREEDYQYPGPLPQSKEAAIMALADSCEAATRSLVEPTPARLAALIKKIISRGLSEGLLDEADITLQEVAIVEKSFLRILLGIHHNRVQYPDQEKGLPPQTKHLNLIKNAK